MRESLVERLMNKHLLKQIAEIVEGVKQVKQQYADKISKEDMQKLIDGDPTENKKYLGWMAKQFLESPDLVGHLIDLVTEFYYADTRRQFQGQEADIYQYANIQELDDVIKNTKVRTDTEQEDTRDKKDVVKSSELKTMQDEAFENGDAELTFENDLVKVVHIKSHVGAQAFRNTPTKPSGVRWCIARKGSSWWKGYWDRGERIYVVYDKAQGTMYGIASNRNEKAVVDLNDEKVPYEEFRPYLTALMQGNTSVDPPKSIERN